MRLFSISLSDDGHGCSISGTKMKVFHLLMSSPSKLYNHEGDSQKSNKRLWRMMED